MSSNRIRDQFSSVGFNIADPLALTAADIGTSQRSAAGLTGDQALSIGDQSRIDVPAGERAAALAARAAADAVAHAHADAALHAAGKSASPHAASLDSVSAAPKFAAASLSGGWNAPAAPDLVHAQNGLPAVLSSLQLAAASTGAEHAGLAGAQGFHQTAGAGHAPGGAPPPSAPVSGQLWAAFGGPGIGNPDGHSDWRIEHADSDGLTNDQVIEQQQTPTGGYVEIGLDTSAGLTVTLDNTFHLRVTNLATGVDLSNTVIASTADFDVVNGFALDANSNTLYVDLFGYDYLADGGDILKITYNQTNGAISNPYSFNDTSHTYTINLNNVLVDSTSSGHKYADGRAFFLSHDGSTLYYVDDNDNDPGAYWGFSTNGVYKISTTGDVGHGTAPVPVLLSSNVQFPTNDSAGYITGIAVSEAKGIIYFTTDGPSEGVSTAQDGIWWMPIAGGTATKMAIPAGVSVSFPVFFGNALAFDIKSQQLYYSDKQTGEIVQFTLAADGHSFSSATNFAAFDTNGGTAHDGGFADAMAFDNLPTLSPLTATGVEAVQGGSAITLITVTPSISDTDNINLRGATITITNAQSGDILLLNGSQSGSASGVSWSYNTSTHVMTLSGEASFATYQSLLVLMGYQDTGTDNSVGSHPTRTINWTISDGITTGHPSTADSNEQTTVVVIDRPPTLSSDNYAVVESATATGTSGTGGTGVLGNDSDKDADAITVTAVNGAAGNVGNSTAGTYGHLTLNANGSFSYTADLTTNIDNAPNGSHPVDSFTYTVSDGLGGVTTTTVTFTIDRPPTVATDSGAAVESSSGSGNVLTNDSDKDGDSLTVSAVNGGAGNVGISVAGTYGHITINSNGSYTYNADNTVAIDAAATGSHLTDTFSYTASDGHNGTTTTTITVTLDRPPTVVADAGAAVESGSAGTGNVLTNDSDRDADTLVVSAVAGSAGNVGHSVAGTYGHLTLNADGTYSYLADNTVAIDGAATGSHLTDTFTYTANDGHGGSTTTNLVITIDRPPTVASDAGTALEGSSGTGNVLSNDSDRDGDSLVVSAVAGSAGNVGNSIAGTYGHLTLNADGSYSYLADNTSAIDGGPNGSHLTDTFSYTASDGHGGTTTTNLVITLDRAPTVVVDSGAAVESGSAGTGNVLSNDSDRDGDSLTVSAVNGGAGNVGNSVAGTYGEITINSNGSYSYLADNTAAIDAAATGSHLTDTFTYTANDGHGGTTSSSITVTIDRTPTVVADAGAAVESSSGTGNVLTNDSDRDGDSLVVSAVAGSAGNVGNSVAGTYGHLTLNADGSYSYLADNTVAIDGAATGSHLTDTFTYTASDGFGGFTTTNLVITLDRAPTVADDSNNALEGGSASANAASGVLANDSDRDGDSLVVSAVAGSAGNVGNSTATTYGHVTVNADGSYSYTADNTAAIDAAPNGSHPVDSVTLTVSDGQGGTTNETLNFTIDRAPTVVDDGANDAEGGTASATAGTGVLANDSDKDGDSLTVSAVNGAAGNVGSSFATTYGHLTLNADGSYSYTADNTAAIDAAATGSHPLDSITVTVSDGQGGTTDETLTFTIDRPAIASADGLSTFENADAISGTGGNANLLANDSDPDGDSFAITAVNGSGANVGTQIALASGALLTVNSDGTYTYDPNHAFDYLPAASSGANSQATDTFTYTITGGATVTVTVTINGVDSNDTLQGTVGADNFNGGIGNDTFKMQDGGNDTVVGGSGNDVFFFGASLTAADQIDGGTGNDRLSLNGDYTGPNAVVFNATTLVNVETITLIGGHSYDLTTNNATVASGQLLTVSATGLGAGDTLTFDGSAETDGSFTFNGGLGTNVLTGGAQADTFVLQVGSTDTLSGGGGNDTFTFGAAFKAADQVDGGTGSDTLSLNGDYTGANAVTFNAATLVNVETITFAAGHSYNLTTDDATVASGQTLTVNGSNLGVGDSLVFNGGADTDGAFAMTGGAGNDTLTGGAQADTFTLSKGGNDTVNGGGGNDTFNFVGAFTASDQVDGGAGSDKVTLNGDYSLGVVFNATTMVNVETINLTAGHSYNLTTADATVASGQTLTVNGSGLGAGDVLTFIGSAETDGNFVVYGGAGNDVLYGGGGNDTMSGGGGNDTFKMLVGGNDTVSGGDGDDTFFFDGTFTAADVINGGSGNDRLSLNGDYTGAHAVVLNATTLTGVETITLIAGHSYDLTPSNSTASSVTTLTVSGSGLGAADSLTFNASGVTSGNFIILGGAGNDTLSGGAGNDVITGGNGTNVLKGGGGQDTLTGGTGADTFVYGATAESTSTTHDIVRGFDASMDFFDLTFAVTGIDATVASGHLGGANFDGNLASAIGAGQLAAYHAVLFTPDSGSYAGHTILVVDANGTAGYQAGQDLVFDLQNPTNVSITTGTFI